MPIRIIIADDHPVTRKGLSVLLSQNPDISIVAETEDGPSTLEAADRLKPNIIIMDISMPGMNGVHATRLLKEKHPQIAVIGLSIHIHKHYILEMLKAGALSYLPKSCDEEEIVRAVHSVIKGKYYLPPEITDAIAADLIDAATRRNQSKNELSARETDILKLLAKGLTITEISVELKISPKTVESHRANISNKLGIKSIAELARYAEREGIVAD